ncbi:MAG TPA: response regulator [Dehalococcoidia bacterium]|nr:response regulator [Dehalococcoidia bacterium]
MRALVVEDHRRIARFLERGLAEEGFAVDVAYDGEEGLAFAEGGSYDVIVLDVVLPGHDGLAPCCAAPATGRRTSCACVTSCSTRCVTRCAAAVYRRRSR